MTLSLIPNVELERELSLSTFVLVLEIRGSASPFLAKLLPLLKELALRSRDPAFGLDRIPPEGGRGERFCDLFAMYWPLFGVL